MSTDYGKPAIDVEDEMRLRLAQVERNIANHEASLASLRDVREHLRVELKLDVRCPRCKNIVARLVTELCGPCEQDAHGR